MNGNITFQDNYLNRLVNKKQKVQILLKSGIQISAVLMGVSKNALFLRDSHKDIIYKNAINTILPKK